MKQLDIFFGFSEYITGIFSPVLVYCAKKNLAPLTHTVASQGTLRKQLNNSEAALDSRQGCVPRQNKGCKNRFSAVLPKYSDFLT
jgi:hypothetical protein